jgi:hypothetical protein
MANAFDEIIIEENPSAQKDIIIADEGPLERSNRSNEQLAQVPSREQIEEEEIKFATSK